MSTDALIDSVLALTAELHPESPVDAVHRVIATDDSGRHSWTVAEAAEALGLSTHTLRYYERAGLVHPDRTSAGYRQYSAADMRRLVFLARMRLSGMSMRDLARYVALVEQGSETEPERREMMLAQRENILRRLQELTLALEATEYKIEVYGGHPDDGKASDG